MKSKNIKEFKQLILRYESITLEEIELKECDANELTGYGKKDTCTLCIPVTDTENGHRHTHCFECIWSRIHDLYVACTQEENAATYNAIDILNVRFDPDKLLKAYRNRAAYMRTVLKKLRIKQP